MTPDRMDTVRLFALETDPEPSHAVQVCTLALALFDSLESLHALTGAERELLEAGALLHDIGHLRDPSGHHKHSRDMILESNLAGFADDEQRIIACLARYHRKALPKPRHKVFADLDAQGQDVVRRLAAILRVADGLDRAHIGATRRVVTECAADEVWLRVEQRPLSETDIWGAMRKRDLFEQTYRVRLTVELAG